MEEQTENGSLAVVKQVSDILNRSLGDLNFAERIELVETILKKYPQVDMPVTHSFLNGMYIRQITIPKGVMLVSRYHKREQFDIMLTGRMSIATDNGMVEVCAPYYGTSLPGLKRIGFAHEETIWVDIRCIRGREIKKLEEELYTDSYQELLEFEAEKYRADYRLLIQDLNVPQPVIDQQVNNLNDQTEVDLDQYQVCIKPSIIEGNGLFAVKRFSAGDMIMPARLSGNRTPAGRYTNHSPNNNAEMFLSENGDFHLVAVKNIDKKEEITVNYRNVLSKNVGLLTSLRRLQCPQQLQQP